MNLSSMTPVQKIKPPATVDVPVFFRGQLMGSERYYVVELRKNKKSITLVTTDGDLRIARDTLVSVEP